MGRRKQPKPAAAAKMSAPPSGSPATKARKPRFIQGTSSLGAEQLFRWEKALAVAEALEDEELSRKRCVSVPNAS